MIATQNPVDQEGTYPLSEAQTDRFMLKEVLRYPSPEEEAEVIFRMDAGVYDRSAATQPVIGLEDMRHLQRVTADIHLDPVLVHYVTQLVHVTRQPDQFLRHATGPGGRVRRQSPGHHRVRRAARARPRCFAGRNHVLPEDIRQLATAYFGTGSSLGSRPSVQGSPRRTSSKRCCKSVRVP